MNLESRGKTRLNRRAIVTKPVLFVNEKALNFLIFPRLFGGGVQVENEFIWILLIATCKIFLGKNLEEFIINSCLWSNSK